MQGNYFQLATEYGIIFFLQLTTFYLGNVAHMAKYSSKIIHCSETLISCKAKAGAGPYQLQSQHITEWTVERTDCSVSPFYCCYCKIPTSEWISILFCYVNVSLLFKWNYSILVWKRTIQNTNSEDSATGSLSF